MKGAQLQSEDSQIQCGFFFCCDGKMGLDYTRRNTQICAALNLCCEPTVAMMLCFCKPCKQSVRIKVTVSVKNCALSK